MIQLESKFTWITIVVIMEYVKKTRPKYTWTDDITADSLVSHFQRPRRTTKPSLPFQSETRDRFN